MGYVGRRVLTNIVQTCVQDPPWLSLGEQCNITLTYGYAVATAGLQLLSKVTVAAAAYRISLAPLPAQFCCWLSKCALLEHKPVYVYVRDDFWSEL